MANVIDIKALSKEELLSLIKSLLNEKFITHELLSEIAENNTNDGTDNMAEIEALINKHFEEYDEVFRKLA